VLVVILYLFVLNVTPGICGTTELNSENSLKYYKEINKEIFNDWKQLIGKENAGFGKGTNHAIRGLEIYKDELYVGTQSLNKSKFWKSSNAGNIDDRALNHNYLSEWHSFIFMKKSQFSNSMFRMLNVKNNYPLMLWLDISLNIGMHARARMSDGCELWRYNSSIDAWFQLVGDNPESDLPVGFGDTNNIAVSVMKDFKGKLYVGTWSSPLKGCEIWRYDCSTWEQVVGKNALIKGGFKESLSETEQNVHNTYAWSAEVYQDHLYIGTFNTNSVFRFENAGCQLWKTSNGENWKKVECPGGDGFGEKENYGIRCMAVYNDELYIATATDGYQPNGPNVQGFEIYKYDGANWTELIGEGGIDQHEKDGFGSKWNKYVWSMIVSSDNKLWVGTLNMQIRMLGENTKGCEVWCYDGMNWVPIVKDHVGEIDSGFGCIYNEGARGIIEYPTGSGNIVIGTFKLMKPFKTPEGCELWIRYEKIL